jgi:hypothetical protein
VFELDRTHLRPILFTEDISTDESIYRKVRKDNTILYESNRYSLPLGTYNKEKEVKIETAEDKLIVWQAFGDYIITEHPLSHGKGQLIKNKNHYRNTENGINELFSMMSNQLDGLCDDFLSEIRKRKSRYVRDQYGLINTLIQKKGVSAVITAIEYCRKYEIFSATDLRDTLEYLENQSKSGEPPKQTVTLFLFIRWMSLSGCSRPLKFPQHRSGN